MFTSLMKSKFYTKCKSLLRMTKTRLDALKKKKNAVARYLKNDVAELLRAGLDYNAYQRAEGLLVELNMAKCYEFIDEFCTCISTNLSDMEKQRECPDTSKEAVQSLIYAAARFAEFPELRDLRSIFAEKYGTSLEAYINKEFVESSRPKPPTKEMKIQLLHEMAQEFSIEWDSKSLEQKLFVPPKPQRGNQNSKNETIDLPSRNANEEKYPYKLRTSSEDEAVSTGWIESTDRESLQASSSSVGSISEDEVETKSQPYYRSIPPPYSRSNNKKEVAELEESAISASDKNMAANEPDSDGDPVEKGKPKPRSVRRRPSNRKQPANYVEDTSGTDKQLMPPPGREKIGDDRNDLDEEEKILDGLLQHYGKKGSHYGPSNKPEPYLKLPLSWQKNSDSTKAPRLRSSKSEPPITPENEAPPEDTTNTRHGRAFSMGPDIQVGHVHPNLPDCDELAARIAALR